MKLLHLISKKYEFQLSKHFFIAIDPIQHKTKIRSIKDMLAYSLVKRKHLWIFDRYSFKYVKDWRNL